MQYYTIRQIDYENLNPVLKYSPNIIWIIVPNDYYNNYK